MSLIDRQVLLLNISLNLKRIRTNKGLSQRKLAEQAQIPVMNVSRMEKGENEPGISHVLAVAAALDIAPHMLWEDPRLIPTSLYSGPK